ncbi:META domain-containing protein [Psychromonas sp.]|nr:META domain-containing protein [Psychromonas sp.]
MCKFKSVFLCAAVFSLTACHSTTPPTSEKVSGTVTYNERILLTQNVVLTVKLEDTAKQDVAAEVISKQSIDVNTPPPWSFDLAYDPKAITAKGDYTLRATVSVNGELRFINISRVPAFDNKEPINIVVSPVSKKQITKQAMLEAHSWTIIELNAEAVNVDKTLNKKVGIHFNAEKKQSSGFAGCNQFSGGYEVTETTLAFAQMISTQMACENSNFESEFLQVLSQVHTYTIDDNRLMLLDVQNKGVAQFEIDRDNLDNN